MFGCMVYFFGVACMMPLSQCMTRQGWCCMAERECPMCGYMVDEDDDYCPECGDPIKKESEAKSA
jgi:hypothetical protein